MRRKIGSVAVLSVVALLAAACGSSSPSASSSGSSSSPPAAAAKFKACVVSDTGTINDKSFNQSAYQGATEAAAGSRPSTTSPARCLPR